MESGTTYQQKNFGYLYHLEKKLLQFKYLDCQEFIRVMRNNTLTRLKSGNAIRFN